ncbi:MAG: hypothetical protein NZ517_06035 [Candidatus Nitrosocaldus sp.]|nr:hypothetical protein [Candidatus Nitrosocaldus sp.]
MRSISGRLTIELQVKIDNKLVRVELTHGHMRFTAGHRTYIHIDKVEIDTILLMLERGRYAEAVEKIERIYRSILRSKRSDRHG